MPGPILHLGAAVLCGHGGQALATAPQPRVRVSGQPIVTVTAPYTVAGCPFTSPPGPCVSGLWVVGAMRVSSLGLPVAIQTGNGLCAPNGAPLVSVAAQPRAKAA
jgi:hypothetical protein